MTRHDIRAISLRSATIAFIRRVCTGECHATGRGEHVAPERLAYLRKDYLFTPACRRSRPPLPDDSSRVTRLTVSLTGTATMAAP